jgi:hypothetical protein
VSDLNGDESDCDPGAMAIVPAGFDGGFGSKVHAGDALVVDYGLDGYEKIYVWSPSSTEGEVVLHDDTDPADGQQGSTDSPLMEPQGLAVSAVDSAIYVSDRLAGKIYTVDPTDGSLTELAADRPLKNVSGLAAHPVTGDLYTIIANDDVVGSEVVRIDVDTGEVTTVMDTLVDIDEMDRPWARVIPQLLFSPDGAHLYVTEPDADTIYELSLSSSVPGDADNDGDVDADDARIVSNNWGSAMAVGALHGDFNGDHLVNVKDAAILAANWGHGVEGEGNAVPEPSAPIALLLLIAATSCSRRRRKAPTRSQEAGWR